MAARTAERTEYLGDIITTAIEGGIGYWSECSQYQYEYALRPAVPGYAGPEGELSVCVGTLEESGGTQATITDTEDGGTFTITIDTIAKGLGLILRGEVGVSDTIREAVKLAESETDAGYIDATAADAIVQIALLGEIRYG